MSGAGWIVEVLPQLEEQPLFDQFKPYLDKKWYTSKLGMNNNNPTLRTALATSTVGARVPVGRVSRPAQ